MIGLEARDVPKLIGQLTSWINENDSLPCPIVASIAHYQFATIHPYYDGNGRIARLLTTLLLHLGGYGLKGLYSLEEYYFGWAESDITPWIDYFTDGMALAFEKVVGQMTEHSQTGEKDYSTLMRTLDPKQRKALELFREYEMFTSKNIGDLFGFKPRTCSSLCKKWVEDGFLDIADPSLKARKYRLAKKYQEPVAIPL